MGNNNSSILDVDENPVEGGAFYGFRVLGIQANSPSSQVGFVSSLDFIVAINGVRLDQKDSTLMELIVANEDKVLKLDVYNTNPRKTRQVIMTPTRKWAGKGLLGVTIRFDSFENADDEVLHVLVRTSYAAEFMCVYRNSKSPCYICMNMGEEEINRQFNF